MRALNKIALTGGMNTFMHRIELELPSGILGFALDSLSGNVITRVKPGSAADMVGISPGVMLVEVNGQDVTSYDYKETISFVKKAERPLRLTVKSKTLLEAKEEENEDCKWKNMRISIITIFFLCDIVVVFLFNE